jgi:predicted GNAT family acetyltransferase
MHVVVHPSARGYWDEVGDFLLRREAENCLPIGIARTLIDTPERYPRFHLFALKEAGRVVGAGWMTPPHPLGLSAVPEAAIPLLVKHARSLGEPVRALVGPKATAVAFKDAWLATHGCAVASQMAQRIFQLSSVVRPPPVEGSFRKATASDRSVLEGWHHDFIVDCNITADGIDAVKACEIGIKTGSRYVWQVDEEVVAMVGYGGETPSGVRVSWVYTPPARRGRGYASALVASMSQKLLDEGRSFCFLYTDLANPTSNGIYQRIGYQPVCDSMHFTFAPTG